jgi:hypothetical protein
MVYFPRQNQISKVSSFGPQMMGKRTNNLNYLLPLKATPNGNLQGTVYTGDDMSSVRTTTYANTFAFERQIIPLPTIGPNSIVNFILCGTAVSGNNNMFDGACQPGAGGEVGWYSGILDGTERYMILEQWGYYNINAFMRLSFVGTTTKYMDVGSSPPINSNGYGACGCPTSRGNTTTGWPGITVRKYGAVRPYNSNIDYSDDSSYSPSPNSTYGSSTFSMIDIAGLKVRAYFGDNTSSGFASTTTTSTHDATYYDPFHTITGQNTGITVFNMLSGALSMVSPAGVIYVTNSPYTRFGYVSQNGYGTSPNSQRVYPSAWGCAIVEIVQNRGALGVTAS